MLTLSHRHTATLSSSHTVTQLNGHIFTWSNGHILTPSNSHAVTVTWPLGQTVTPSNSHTVKQSHSQKSHTVTDQQLAECYSFCVFYLSQYLLLYCNAYCYSNQTKVMGPGVILSQCSKFHLVNVYILKLTGNFHLLHSNIC